MNRKPALLLSAALFAGLSVFTASKLAYADRYATYTDLNGYELTAGRNDRNDLKKQVKAGIKSGSRSTVYVAVNAGSIQPLQLAAAVRDGDEAYTNVKVKRVNSFTIKARWVRNDGNRGTVTVIENGKGH